LAQSEPVVQILVAQAERAAGPLAQTAAILCRLGADVRVAAVTGAAACLERVRAGGVDLVVLDLGLGVAARALLSALRGVGPPVVAVTPEPGNDVVRDAFLLGAAECVIAGPEYARVLPVVVLEQIRRWRALLERGAIEQRLRRLEYLNDAIVRAIPAALAVLGPDARVVGVNPEFARVFGVDPARAAGASLEEILPPGLLPRERLLELLREATVREVELRVSTPGQGRAATRSFDVRLARLDDEGRLLLVLWDVTEAEQLNRRLAELKRYNENIIQNMNSALLVVDREGRIAFANPTAEGILRGKLAELRGRSIWEWLSDTPRGRELLERTLREGVRFRGAETVITHPSGQVVPIGISCAPLQGANGRPVGAVALFQDLSEIKELQRHVSQTERMASIGQLAAGVAHEINNPMGFIHANLCQMAEYLSDLRRLWESVGELQDAIASGRTEPIHAQSEKLATLSAEIDSDFVFSDFGKALRESQEGSERIRHIVQDLRQFARNDAGERSLADVTECLDTTANIVGTMMKHTVVLKKDYEDLPRVRCYPMQIKQVFMNLLVNAFQAIQERVGTSGETGEIRLETHRRPEGIVVVVSDTGIGIPPENLPRIFDPFFTTKEVGIGMGLGLSTSFSIIQRHGGALRVESKPGVGSRFEVYLPLTSEDSAPQPAA
jgi:PAS domain S-box-containing protein